MELSKEPELEQSEKFDEVGPGLRFTGKDDLVVPGLKFDGRSSSILLPEEETEKQKQIMQLVNVGNNTEFLHGKTMCKMKSKSDNFEVNNMDDLVNNVNGSFHETGSVLIRPSSDGLKYSFSHSRAASPPEGHSDAASPRNPNSSESLERDSALGQSHKEDSHPTGWNGIQSEPALPISLEFQDVKYKVAAKGVKNSDEEKYILHGITGSVHPGEVLSLMGPSGGGKTTLLNLLSGRVKFSSGSITYNDQTYSKWLKRRIGFVTQDDVVFPHLTVKETLTYAAMLRLPSILNTQQKKERAMNVISELGLERCQNTLIGGKFVSGISGGERKRVCIGNEILLNPSLLFLDEPTSGLDSTTALRIVQILENFAEAGRTVVTTIHQPSSRLFSKFDKLILLAKGSSLYFGKASEAMLYFSSIGCNPLITMNPAEFLIDLANGNINDKSIPPVLEGEFLPGSKILKTRNGGPSPAEVHECLVEAYEAKLAKTEKRQLLKLAMTNHKAQMQGKLNLAELRPTWLEQFCILFRRSLKERRHEYLSFLRVIQVIATAIILGLLWWRSDSLSPNHIKDQAGLLFFISVFWGFFPSFTAIFTFPQERAMLAKERSVGMYRLSAYFAARNLSDLPLDLFLPTIFLAIVYFMGGLKLSFSAISFTMLTIFLSIVAAQGFGLSIGAAFMDVKKATTMASTIIMAFMLSGGFFLQRVPPFMSWMKYISFNYHTYRLLLKIQYSCSDSEPPSGPCQSPFIRELRLNQGGTEVGSLLLMIVVYRLLAYSFLRKMRL